MLRRRLIQTGHDRCQRWTVIKAARSSGFRNGWGIVDPLADYAGLKEHSAVWSQFKACLNYWNVFWSSDVTHRGRMVSSSALYIGDPAFKFRFRD